MIPKSKQGEGICPVCGNSKNMRYEPFQLQDEGGFYPFECPECGATGREWFDFTWVESVPTDYP